MLVRHELDRYCACVGVAPAESDEEAVLTAALFWLQARQDGGLLSPPEKEAARHAWDESFYGPVAEKLRRAIADAKASIARNHGEQSPGDPADEGGTGDDSAAP